MENIYSENNGIQNIRYQTCDLSKGSNYDIFNVNKNSIQVKKDAEKTKMISQCDKDLSLFAKGIALEDACGKKFTVKGMNWAGAEGKDGIVHGLWTNSIEETLDLVAKEGVNFIQIPLSLDNIVKDPPPAYVNFKKNPELLGLSSKNALKKIIDTACERNIRISLSFHDIYPNEIGENQTELWYEKDGKYSEEKIISVFSDFIESIKDKKCVVAVKGFNEPHGQGSDWKKFADFSSRFANSIHAKNPNILFFMTGISPKEAEKETGFWGNWGSVIGDSKELHVKNKSKLAFSPNLYMPKTFTPQDSEKLKQFWKNSFQNNVGTSFPIVISEFGGAYNNENDIAFQKNLISYILDENIAGGFYWAINPWGNNDVGGFLNRDWKSVDGERKNLLLPLLERR